MTKEYDPLPRYILKLEMDNDRLRHLLDLARAVRRAQAAYFKDRSKDNLIASKVAEADFDKAARAYAETTT